MADPRGGGPVRHGGRRTQARRADAARPDEAQEAGTQEPADELLRAERAPEPPNRPVRPASERTSAERAAERLAADRRRSDRPPAERADERSAADRRERPEAPAVRPPEGPARSPETGRPAAAKSAGAARVGTAEAATAGSAAAAKAGAAQAKRTDAATAEDRAPTSAPVVPPQSVAGRALILVVSIMAFLACLAWGALTLVNDAARDWQSDVSREVTIQLKPTDGVAMEPAIQRAMQLARGTNGVRTVRLLSDKESAALLEPWLGAGLDLAGLPVPRLIVIELSDPSAADLSGLKQRLGAEVRGAILDDHSVWAHRLRTMASTMVVAGSVVLVLVLMAMVLSVVFATRAAMAGNKDVIEVLHFVGAEDAYIAREFQHHFLVLGLKGGMVGGVTSMLAFAIVEWVTRDSAGSAVADQVNALFGGISVGLSGYLGAMGIIALVAGLTAVTSRLTVRSYLAQLE